MYWNFFKLPLIMSQLRWIVTLDVLKSALNGGIATARDSWIVTLDVLK